MIDPKELRIGNYINTVHENGQMYTHKIDGKDIAEIEIYPLDRHSIPLTEEWILRCGFVKDFDETYVNRIYELHIGRKEIRISTEEDNDLIFRSDIGLDWAEIGACKSVHGLQNIAYVLTGEELTIPE